MDIMDIEQQKTYLWESYDLGLLTMEEVEEAIKDINERAGYLGIL
jgi:hypothetical protein